MRFLVMCLEAPLMSCGAAAVGKERPTGIWPGLAMLTGLLANAQGFQARERGRLQKLQESLIFGARVEVSGTPLVDYQTAQLNKKDDLLWRTDGTGPDKRAGGDKSYTGPWLRYKHYLCGHFIILVLTLRAGEGIPCLEDLAHSLKYPSRPLFLGRACCLPSGPVFRDEWVEAETVRSALSRVPPLKEEVSSWEAEWPSGEGSGTNPKKCRKLCRNDLRDWLNDVHAGGRYVFRGTIHREEGTA